MIVNILYQSELKPSSSGFYIKQQFIHPKCSTILCWILWTDTEVKEHLNVHRLAEVVFFWQKETLSFIIICICKIDQIIKTEGIYHWVSNVALFIGKYKPSHSYINVWNTSGATFPHSSQVWNFMYWMSGNIGGWRSHVWNDLECMHSHVICMLFFTQHPLHYFIGD